MLERLRFAVLDALWRWSLEILQYLHEPPAEWADWWYHHIVKPINAAHWEHERTKGA